jgi:hypothetical protein
MARLLLLLALAYVWTVALGSQVVAMGQGYPLVKRPHGVRHRVWSLFREGLRFFVEVAQRDTICLDLIFIPDHRFT